MYSTSRTSIMLRVGDRTYTVSVAGSSVRIEERNIALHVTDLDGRHFVVSDGERSRVAIAAMHDGRIQVFVDGEVHEIEREAATGRRRGGAARVDRLTSPMPATVTRLLVAEGDHVTSGQTLALVEAMKMELPVRAPRDGTVQQVCCRQGELVQPDQTLIELE